MVIDNNDYYCHCFVILLTQRGKTPWEIVKIWDPEFQAPAL